MADFIMPDASSFSPDPDEPLHGGYTRFELELEVPTAQQRIPILFMLLYLLPL